MASEIRGDQTWVPCGALETDHDLLLFNQGVPGTPAPASIAGTIPDTTSNFDFGAKAVEAQQLDAEDQPKAETGESTDGKQNTIERPTAGQERPASSSNTTDLGAVTEQEATTSSIPQEEADTSMTGDTALTMEQLNNANKDSNNTNDTAAIPEPLPEEDPAAAHQMTTRSARARDILPASPTSPNLPTTPSSPQVHPFFLPPAPSLPSKSYGLPPMEADDTRRLLYAYCQRQEEVVRGVQRLYHGLLRAKRMKNTVWEWCNAEGHIGEMSDGEDWVDEAAWKLAEGELKKGEDEVEEGDVEVVVGGRGAGVAAGGGKKTRGRRGAGA